MRCPLLMQIDALVVRYNKSAPIFPYLPIAVALVYWRGDTPRAAVDLGVHIHYLNCLGIRSDIFADATPMAESAAP